MEEIRKVALYCRVSTEEQANEGYSIQAQLQTLRHYAKLYNWHISNEYVDEGISGKNISSRPAIQQLMADVENDEFEAVLVWKISRLSRNMLDTLVMLDKFEENNVKFISYSENFDTGSPIGRLVVQLMASIAEMERNTLSENVKLGMKQRATEGSWNGGIVFGYNSVEKELVINEDEAKVVRLIYELYLSGKGLKAIANHLNKRGYRTKRNKYFSINGVAQILDNPIYKGKISWLKVENWDTKRRKGKNPNPILVDGKHEAIIANDLWHLVQTRRMSKSFKQRQSNEPFLLSSLLRCPDCGQGMVPSITSYTRKDGTKRKHRYYVCSDFHNKGSSACKSNGIKAYEAENKVIGRIENFLTNGEYFISTIQSLNNQSFHATSELKRDLERIEKRLLEIEQLQEKYLEAFEQNLFPVAILQERLQQVAREKTKLEQMQNELSIQLSSSDTRVIPHELVRFLLKRFVEVYQLSSREVKKQLLQQLIGRITIRQLENRSRSIHQVELDFDFTEVNISKTFTLIHLLHRETDKDVAFSQPLPASDNKIPPYLQQFLPLFMVRFPPQYPKRPIHLLHQDQSHQLVRKCHLRKRQSFIRPSHDFFAQS